MPNHNISFVKSRETKNDVINVGTYDENVKENEEDQLDDPVGFIEAKARKSQTKMPLDISFSE
jgi:hypothetical protein